MSSVTGLCSGMPNTALDDVCTTLATRASRAATSTLAVPPTFTSSNSARSLASGTWATLWKTTSTPSHARAHRGAVADVAGDELGAGQRRAGRVQVEDADRVTAGEGLLGEHGAEVAAAAGDQDRARHQSRSPRSRHQRTLARMPSSSATVGLVAELLARPRDVARDRVLQLAEHVQRPARSARSPARAASSFSATTPAIRGTGSGRRFDTRAPRPRARRAPFARRRAARRARRRRSSTRRPGAASAHLGAQHALHEVARCTPSTGAAYPARRAGTGPAGPPRGTASGGPVGTDRRTTAGAR